METANSGITPHSKMEYLQYSIAVAAAMENHAIKHGLPIEQQTWIDEKDPELKPLFDQFFALSDMESETLRRASPLVNRKNQWG